MEKEKIFLAEEKKSRERKGRKYLESEKTFLRRRRKQKRKGGIIMEKEKLLRNGLKAL